MEIWSRGAKGVIVLHPDNVWKAYGKGKTGNTFLEGITLDFEDRGLIFGRCFALAVKGFKKRTWMAVIGLVLAIIN